MIMKNIPTAEEFLLNHPELSQYDVAEYDEGGYLGVNENKLHQIMIEFAKLHVQAALSEALDSIPCLGSSSDIATYEEVEDAVLNSYPFENIK
jgi:hypothetical protein